MKSIKRESILAAVAFLGILVVFEKLMFSRDGQTAILLTTLVVAAALFIMTMLFTKLFHFLGLQNLADIKKASRSCLSMLCALAILVGISPAAFAVEEHVTLDSIRAEIVDYMEANRITVEMTDDELLNAYFSLNSEECEAAWTVAEALYEKAQSLSEDELAVLDEDANTKLCFRYYNQMMRLNSPVLMAEQGEVSTTITVGGAKFLITATPAETKATPVISTSGSTVTLLLYGYTTESTSCGDTEYTDNTTTYTIKVTNQSTFDGTDQLRGVKFTISENSGTETPYDWLDTTSVTSATLGSSYTSGAGAIDSGKGTPTPVTLTLTFNILELETTDATYRTDFADSQGGTYTVDGAAHGEYGEKSDGSTYALAATANEGYTFFGWYSEANGIIAGLGASGDYKVSGADTIRPIFKKNGSAQYTVQGVSGGSFVYLDEAIAFATAKSASCVMVSGDGVAYHSDASVTNPTFTIPTGITLLIPFDDVGTLYTDTPGNDGGGSDNTWVKPTQYRKLTLQNGTSISVSGAISLSAKHHAGGASDQAGSPTGPVSFLQMDQGSSITVNNGGALYAWGYITGKGNITAETGAKVYENFQLNDFRGGTHTAKVATMYQSYGVFPFNSYFVQNIEVAMTVKAGASLTTYLSVYANSQPNPTPVPFIAGSGAMFSLTSGYLVKDYNEAEDRLIVTVNGDLSVSPVTLSLSGQNFDSSAFNLPINSNITVNVESGTVTLAQDVAMLPSATINVAQGANIVVASEVSIYMYDLDDWETTYTYKQGVKFRALAYAPGRVAALTDDKLTDATICIDGTADTSAGYVYTTSGGANIYSNGTGSIKLTAGSAETTNQVTALAGTLSAPTFETVSITPAKLKNADGTYLDTTTATYNYCGTHGVWYTGEECAKCVEENHVCKDNATYHAKADSTCIATGTSEHWSCSKCGKNYSDADCTTEVSDLTIAMKSHSYSGEWVYTEAGHAQKCVNGCEQTNPTVTDHTWNSGVQTTAPTCSTAGVKTYTCTDTACSKTKTEPISATGNHTYTVEQSRTEPTCYQDGSVVKKCATCTLTTTETLTATGQHVYGDNYITENGKHWQQCTTNGCTAKQNEADCSGGTATCTAKAICTECGQEYGELAAHTPGAAATCTTAQTCTVCGATVTAALGHTWTAATCTAPKTCSVCKVTEGEATGHTPASAVRENVVEATCTAEGSYDEVVYCSVCNTELSRESKVLELAAHTEGAVVVENEVAATCTAEGSYDNVVYCSVCNEELSRNTVTVDKIAHTPAAAVEENRVESTCTVAGSYDEVVYCSACNTELSRETKALELAAHTEGAVVVENEVAATCTAEGSYDNVVYCTACNEELSRNTVTVEKIAHTPAAAVEENRVESTCTVAGSYDEVVYCSACNTELSRETKALELASHTEGEVVVENEKAATCTAEGSYDNVVYCSVCNEELSRNTVTVDKIAHNYEAVVTAPTCTEDGYTTYTCSVCDDTYTADKVDALGHTEVIDAAVAPTCTATGLTEGSHCDVCGEVLVAQTVVDAKGHTKSDVVVENEEAATCTKDGSYDNVVYCTVCDAELSRETVTVDKLGHTAGSVVVENNVDPTCTTAGSYDNVTYCTVCDAELSRETVTVDKLGHTVVVDAAVDATCTATGLTEGSHCSVCKAVLVDQEVVSALGHTDGDAVVENNVDPDCENGGSYDNVTYCTVCGAETSRTAVTVDKLGHTDGEVVVENEVKADCENSGSYDKVTYCTVCGDETSRETVTVDAKGHTEGETVIENSVAATCSNAGSYQNVVYCSVCGDELSRETVTVDKLPHTEVIDAAKAPTCAETGLTEGKHCSVCNEVIVAQTTVAATGKHIYTSVVTKEATCSEAGVMTYTCGTCGDSYTEVIDATGHTEVEIPAVDATCTTAGSTAGVKCSVCGEILTTQEEIPVLGHTEATREENRVEATCGKDGSYDLVTYCSVCTEVIKTETKTIPATGEHSYVGGKCSVCEAEEPVIGTIIDTGRSLSLSGVIYVNQYIKVKGFEGIDIEENGGLLIWKNSVTEDSAVFGTQDIHQPGLIKTNNEYAQQTHGIVAREYADALYLRVYIKDNEGNYIYGPLNEYSVRTYCENKINGNSDQKLKDTCVEMLHFGSAAQVYFNYNLDNLANKNIVESYPQNDWNGALIDPLVPANTKLVGTGTVKDNGKSLSLSGAIQVNFYFKLDTSVGTPTTSELLVWSGVNGELTLDNVSYRKELIKSGGEYAQQSEMTPARALSETIYACAHFVDSEGNHHYSDIVSYSPEYYANRQIEKNANDKLVALVKAMVLYGEAARIYFS